VATAISFVDAINHADADRLRGLMTSEHALQVFDEEPLVGREANVEAWRGYFTSCPRYVIYPGRVAESDGMVAILGHTTGSHLGLPDDEERHLTLIWLVTVRDGAVSRFRLVEDGAERRVALGLG